MSVVVSAVEAMRTRVCPAPGCPNEITRPRADFCDACRRELSTKARRRIVRQAEIARQGALLAERRGQEFTRRLRRRRRFFQGRVRAVQRIEREADLARNRGDEQLEEVLRQAAEFVEAALTSKAPGSEKAA